MLVLLYPLVLLLFSALLNYFLLGKTTLKVELPSQELIIVISIAIGLLVLNHTWLMTATELTRVNFKLYATPEEWKASGNNKQAISNLAKDEIERNYNAHRNTTENVVYFVMASLVYVLTAPSLMAASTLLIGFAVFRLGYSYSYLLGSDNLRGLFMTLSLLWLYTIISNPLIRLMVS